MVSKVHIIEGDDQLREHVSRKQMNVMKDMADILSHDLGNSLMKLMDLACEYSKDHDMSFEEAMSALINAQYNVLCKFTATTIRMTIPETQEEILKSHAMCVRTFRDKQDEEPGPQPYQVIALGTMGIDKINKLMKEMDG